MTPTLARFVRLARIRLGSIVPSEREWAELQREENLDRFKMYIAQKTNIDVRLELFTEITRGQDAESCSLQFRVDEKIFVLRQTGSECKLIFRIENHDISATLLANDDDFEDHLLVAIDDALRQAQN